MKVKNEKYFHLMKFFKLHLVAYSLLCAFFLLSISGCKTEKKSNPSISSISPIAGTILGGTHLTISGSNFAAGSIVSIGNKSCAVSSVSDTQISCTTSANTAGVYGVVVTSPNRQNVALASAFTYNLGPILTSISPSSGLASGGTSVTITGENFYAGTTANIGGVDCSGLTVIDSTTLTCTTGAHAAGVVSATVTTPDTLFGSKTSAFTYRGAPTVTSVGPSAGALAGGTTITLTGTGFYSGASVVVGGSACSSVVVVNSTTITCSTPAHLAGAVTVSITNADSQSGSRPSAFTYQVAPTVTSVSPLIGTTNGGTTVTITGSDFVSGATVKFDTSTCLLPIVFNSTTIQCTTAAHAAGAVSVTVTNSDNQSGSVAAAFTYQLAPTVTSVSLNSGALAGGSFVTITGTNFFSGATATFGGISCTGVTVVSSTSMTCSTPAHIAGAVSVAVTNTDGQIGSSASAFIYRAAPTITSASPNAGALAGGRAITITGSGFYTGSTVTVGGSTCSTPVVVNSTTITCTTPAHAAGAVTIAVTNADTQTGNTASAFTYQVAPTITSLSPNSGALAGGSLVTITGTDFISGATVTIGGSTCTLPVFINSTTLQCTTPSHAAAGAVNVSVTNPDTQTGSGVGAYTYQVGPTVSSVSLNSGALAGGSAVTITGTNFLSGASATFGGNTCTSVTVVSATSITCTTPAHAAGAVSVTVSNSDGQSGTANSAFTYRAAPTITSASPNAGALAGGSVITITGTGFFTGSTVTLDGATCSTPVVVNPTTITCTTPAHAAGAVTIAVTNTDTQTGNTTSAFTYQVPPSVLSLSPNIGTMNGGTTVTITGTDFVSGATVKIGGNTCTLPIFIDANTIECTSPSHASGTADVIVTNADTQSGSLSNGFFFLVAPSITNITNHAGPLAGGTTITIAGNNFFAGATVDLAGSACTSVNIISANSLTCVTPAHAAGAVAVTITNPDGQIFSALAGFTYQVAPTVTSVAFNAGALAGATAVTITGTDFVTGATVDFGGSVCVSPVVVNSSTITCTTSAHAAGTVNVNVTNADTQSGSAITAYTYQAAPSVISVNANSGYASGGTNVTITGADFLAGATVSFGGATCSSPVVVNSTTITCTTSVHAAGAVTVTVTNIDSQSGSTPSAFTYIPAPTVTGVSLNAGALAGGSIVTVSGSGFISGAIVDFDGLSCTSVTVVSSTSITCTTPAHIAGAVTVTVTNTDGQSGNKANAFTYQVAPTVTSVSFNAGSLAGGTAVTISGTHFLLGATVDFDGSSCTNPVVVNSTSITCTTPAHTAGAVSVTVTNADTQSGNAATAYTYQAAPSITSVALNAGALAGGTSVTITGTDFLSGAAVSFGGSACTGITVVSATSITCTTPTHAAGAVTVIVTNTDSQSGNKSSAYTYQAAPTISSIALNAGALAGGTSITITGTGFISGASVDVGGSVCTSPVVVNASTLTCLTPAHVAGAVSVTVTNSDTQSATAASAYTFQAAPTVTSVTDNAGAMSGGNSVSITGTNFLSGATVDFGGSTCTSPIIVNSTNITCTTPAHAVGAVTVTVTNTDTQSGNAASAYTFQAAPTVTSISPNSGFAAGGSSVTITGTNFLTGASVNFGGSACSSVVVVSATSLTCTTSAHATGAVSVTVTNNDNQSGSAASAFTYVGAPTITSVSLNAGAVAGGKTITISGTGFTSGALVDLDGSACTSVNVASSTSLTCITPAHAVGAVTVTVTNTDTQSAIAASAYTYQVAPTLTSVSANSGSIAGGTSVTLTGADFLTGATVTFGGATCTSPVVVNSTTITCTTSAHAAGPVTVVVTNADTQTGSAVAAYTYQAAPTVLSVSLNSGPLAGGTAVTVTGTNFLAGAAVDFGGSACSSVVVVSTTSITCTTPTHAAGAVSVSVTNTDTQVGSATAYTYRNAPTVASASLNSGAIAGGTPITITGSGFYSGASVDIGGFACTSVVVVNSTSITCATPAHAAGAVTITVTNADTQSGNAAAAYTYQAAPTVSNVTPSAGPISGGTTVTINGTGFISGATIAFGGVNCTLPIFVNSTSYQCTTPVHSSGIVSVIVTNPDNQTGTLNSGFFYLPAPILTSVSLNSGPLAGGNSVTLSGSNFISGLTVSFGGSACTSVVIVNSSTLTCTTPAHAAGAIAVSITNPDGQIGSTANAYTYRPAPTVSSVAPSGGPIAGGTTATITGTGFYSGASVTFGGSNCASVTVVSGTSITCTVPAHAGGAVTVAVTNADTQTGNAAAAYTYQSGPTFSSIDITSGFAAGGTFVSISGANFLTGATVSFGGSTCTGVTVVSSTNITCTTASHAAGIVNIVITNTDSQIATASSAFTYLAAPVITSISPAEGSISGGTPVTITGTGFVSGASIDLGGSACGAITVVSSTSITCTTGARAAGLVNVTVTNTDTQTGSLANSFTYQSMADLRWQVGITSPNPPDPDSYGSTATNITHTYTLKNIGDTTSSTITLSITGATPAAWLFGTDTCSGPGNELAPGASCTIQVTFLGQFLPTGSYTGILNATAAGATASNIISGSIP